MMYKNKLILGVLVFCSVFNLASAQTNKEYLLSEITTLETKIATLKTTKISDAETKVYALSKSYDEAYVSLGYDSKTVDYLVSLWKLTSNFKKDIWLELNTITSEINTKTAQELADLSTIKNTINLNYTTISDADKTNLASQIALVQKDYDDLNSTYSTKITSLNTKYTASLTTYKSTLANVISSNSTTISTLQNFAKNYDTLYTSKLAFDTNYDAFKKNYLWNASELTSYTKERQNYYVGVLKADMEKLRDLNIQSNSSLADYKADIDRYMQVLLENFSNAMWTYINDNFWVVYSDSDITNLNARFTALKNKYYDSDSKLIPNEVLSSSSWALSEVAYLKTNFETISGKIVTLNWTWTINLWNLKVRLDNEFAKYYNANYTTYRDDLYVKLKEKLNLSLLETKNVLVAADSIDIRYQMLADKIEKSNDLTYINKEINSFRNDLKKYDYLNSSILTSKINKLNYNLVTFIVQKELSTFKYVKLTPKTSSYNAQLEWILSKMKDSYGKDYTTYLKSVLDKVDAALESSKLSTKNRFVLLLIKQKLVTELNN